MLTVLPWSEVILSIPEARALEIRASFAQASWLSAFVVLFDGLIRFSKLASNVVCRFVNAKDFARKPWIKTCTHRLQTKSHSRTLPRSPYICCCCSLSIFLRGSGSFLWINLLMTDRYYYPTSERSALNKNIATNFSKSNLEQHLAQKFLFLAHVSSAIWWSKGQCANG